MNSKSLAWLIRRNGIEMTHISHGSHIGRFYLSPPSLLSYMQIVAMLIRRTQNGMIVIAVLGWLNKLLGYKLDGFNLILGLPRGRGFVNVK